MSDDLTRKIEELVIQIIAGMDEPETAIAALIAEEREAARKEGCAWAEAIERWFIEWEMLPDWSAADPWAELHRMICWEQQVALDPAVSEDARKLIAEERARAFEEAAERIAIDERSERELLDLAREQRNAPGVAMHSYAASALAQHYGAIRALAKKETPGGE